MWKATKCALVISRDEPVYRGPEPFWLPSGFVPEKPPSSTSHSEMKKSVTAAARGRAVTL